MRDSEIGVNKREILKRERAAVARELEVLTLQQASDFLQISERTAWAMAREGTIPAFRAGTAGRGQWRFLRSKLIEWAAEQSRAS